MTRPETEPATEPTPAEKLALSLRLFANGCAMMRENLRREYPEDDDEGVEELLDGWLRHRPGAEDGDWPGRKVTWPRRGTQVDG